MFRSPLDFGFGFGAVPAGSAVVFFGFFVFVGSFVFFFGCPRPAFFLVFLFLVCVVCAGPADPPWRGLGGGRRGRGRAMPE